MAAARTTTSPARFKLKANLANDYFIDRAAQKTESFTGIKGINTQDVALQEGMGPITDRTQEHLGTSDRAIAVMRRLLLEAVSAVERGEPPRGSDAATYRSIRPHDGLVAGRQRLARSVRGRFEGEVVT